jgi:hypothetical protein
MPEALESIDLEPGDIEPSARELNDRAEVFPVLPNDREPSDRGEVFPPPPNDRHPLAGLPEPRTPEAAPIRAPPFPNECH